MSGEPASAGLFDRALRRLADVWRDVAGGAADGAEPIEAQMRACLEGRGGEVSARARAARLAGTYLAADAAGRAAFFRTLASFDSDPAAVDAAYAAVREAPDAAARAAAKARLRRVLEPPRLRLLSQFTTLPDGMKFLVDFRAALRAARGDDPTLAALESDFRSLLANWFDVGFLELRRIDWSSPASLLEKFVGYEAVHEIRSWRDLKNRLDSDRRCYAFFHPRMPGEPLIFVEIALVAGLADSVQRLLDPKAPLTDPHQADTAIFYSISNCQDGLVGISFGNFLIKRVVEELSSEFRNLKRFATLSPMPGFRAWLGERILAREAALLGDEEAASLAALAPAEARHDRFAAFAALLARPAVAREGRVWRVLAPVLLRLAARYLLAESAPRDPRRARDPVAHFHLANGARVERINPLADISERGVRESVSLMVNYLYDPARIEAFHEEYAGAGRRNAASAVRRLVRSAG